MNAFAKPRPRALVAPLLAILALAWVLPTTALAQPRGGDDEEEEEEPSTAAGAGAPEEDDGLYDCPERRRRGKYVVSLKPETTLDDLIKWAMTFHCRNFVYGSGIGGRNAKVTIMTPDKMTAGQAWRVFLVALQSMNLTVVPKGNVLEIVEQATAKNQPLPIFSSGRAPGSDQMVRVVLRPEHLAVEDLQQILDELKSKTGNVKAIPNAGLVMVTDLGSVVQKMANLMMMVDQSVAGERLFMIRVQNADATELATKLQEILGSRENNASAAAAQATQNRRTRRGRRAREPEVQAAQTASTSEVEVAVPSKIIPDERTNSLIVLGSEASYLRVKALVERLDVGIDVEGAGRIHVYLLENADAQEMAETLTSVISGIQQQQQQQGANQRRQRAPTQAAVGDSAAAFEGQVRVTHDKPTNSLVIVASVKDFIALRDVIEKLDLPRPQVYIEATIVEIGVDNSRELGTSFHGGADVGDGNLLIGGVQHNDLASLNVATLATSTGLLGGALGPLLENAEQLLGQSIPSFGVLFQALATSSNVNVLSSPHILTTDNEEAEISVGQNIPYQSALVGLGGQQGAGNFFPTQSIQRQDVALTLKLTPHINASSMVRLEIDLEISDIASQDFQGLGPSWAKRTIVDTVVVRDQQSVVIGGLMEDREVSSESKVPLLGDIPILGYLFKYSSRRKEKRNLLVLLTPHIVQDQMDIERIVERRVREQREFIRTFSTFSGLQYRPDLDYRRKRGVVEEINRTVRQAQADAALLEELESQRVRVPDGPIEYEGEPAEDEPELEPLDPGEDIDEAGEDT